jgi:hypothetical protein
VSGHLKFSSKLLERKSHPPPLIFIFDMIYLHTKREEVNCHSITLPSKNNFTKEMKGLYIIHEIMCLFSYYSKLFQTQDFCLKISSSNYKRSFCLFYIFQLIAGDCLIIIVPIYNIDYNFPNLFLLLFIQSFETISSSPSVVS